MIKEIKDNALYYSIELASFVGAIFCFFIGEAFIGNLLVIITFSLITQKAASSFMHESIARKTRIPLESEINNLESVVEISKTSLKYQQKRIEKLVNRINRLSDDSRMRKIEDELYYDPYLKTLKINNELMKNLVKNRMLHEELMALHSKDTNCLYKGYREDEQKEVVRLIRSRESRIIDLIESALSSNKKEIKE